MKKLIGVVTLLSLALSPLLTTQAATTPAEDREAFREYFKKNMPSNDLADYKNGIYAFNKDAREQWEEIEEFPPYEIQLDKGEELWEKKFANGKSFEGCLGKLDTIRAKYPHFDEKNDTIVTLEGSINKCLTDNSEKPLKWKKGKMASLSGYIARAANGQKIKVKVKGDKAIAWYNKGKTFFYAKRGQLNLSCADCHVYFSSKWIRGDNLGPALGHPTHFPVFRSKWGELGTLHRRYAGCNKQVRAKPFKAQSDEYKALEYFQAVMSDGLEINGPSARK